MAGLPSPRAPNWLLVSLYITAFVAAGAAAPYIAVFFQDLGLSLDAIGLLAAAIALCAVFGSPIWGALADQSLGARTVLVIASLGAAAMAVVVGLTDVVVIAAAFAVLFSVASAGITPVLYAVTLDRVGEDRSRFALYRVWGSLAFVVSAVLVGVVVDATSLRFFFVPLVVSLVVGALLALGIPARTAHNASRSLDGIREVLGRRSIVAFLVASLIVWGAGAMVNDFLGIYLVSLNAPKALVGSAFAISAIVEVPTMLCFPILARRLGLTRVMVIGAVLLLARTAVLLVSSDPYVATASMVLYGAGVALLLVGGVAYVAGLAPDDRHATAQGIFVAVVAGLASAAGPALAGIVAGATSLPAMFVLAAVISAIGVGAIWLALFSSRFAAASSQASPDVAAAG